MSKFSHLIPNAALRTSQEEEENCDEEQSEKQVNFVFFFLFSYILCVHLSLFFYLFDLGYYYLKIIPLFAQHKLLHTEPVSVLNKLLESKDARKKTGNNSGVFF